MSNVGFATLSVIPSFQGFQSRLSAGVAAPMTSAGRDGGRKFGDAAGREAGDRFKRGWSDRLKGFAPLAGIAVGAGAVAFFKDAIEGASDLSESGNKINAIFGDAQATVQDFASDASDSLGQTKLQALDAASTFGTFGKAAGLTGDALAGFSTELVSLSTDMASFYNTDVSTAIEAIGSGLRGEAEPLRQFGVLLDDATLRAEAMKQGLISSTKEALTPQQKVLAAHAVILKQTTDAQGDFARTSDGLANQQRILTAQLEEMKTKVGAELLPAMTNFVGFLSQDALPALGEVGGLAKDAASAFNELPAPIKASAAAFVALRIAAATGLTATAASGVSSLASGMDTLRLRTMLASDAFREARTTTMTFNGNVGTVSRKVGVLSASMQGLRAGAAGAGSALKRGLGGAMSLMGGPWGLAMLAGTAAIAHFWQESQEAKQRIDDMTASLNEQTGALTKNSRELAFKALQESGAVDIAKRYGIALDDLTDAALGNSDAQQRVTAAMNDQASAFTAAVGPQTHASGAAAKLAIDQAHLREAIGSGASEVRSSREARRDHAEAMGEAADATGANTDANDDAARSFRSLADRVNDAKDAIKALAEAENERRLARVQAKRDELALIETMQATRREAREGKKTLDEQTKAGQKNWEALLDLADQWNNTKPKVQEARGAYEDVRAEFVKSADQMGKTKKQAEELADKYLKVPKRLRTEVTTPGMDAALAKLERLAELSRQAARRTSIEIHTRGKSLDGYATGGFVSGFGTKTSDSIPAWLSNGEFVQPASTVDYYGRGFMEALRRRLLPRQGYATGGLVQTEVATSGGGVNVYIDKVVAQDYGDFMGQMQRRAQRAALDGRRP